ncbi:MAG: endolytic transglycosylase MltG [Elusimicrobiota bacterium]
MNIKNSTSIKIIALFLLGVLFLSIRSSEMAEVEVSSGMSAPEIAETLSSTGIIGSKNAFLFFLRITGKSKDLKAGTYILNKKMNYFSLVRKLVRGSEIFIRVTIPEGFTAEQIGRRLWSEGIITDADEFTDTVVAKDLRGFLFPETYNLSRGRTVEEVIDIMINQFNMVFGESYRKRAGELGFTVKKIVTLASLIEKEAKIPEERPVISAIFHSRLKKRKYLESCASVLFAIGEHKKKLVYKDLEIDSPYNTYRHFGLPPTPICNPGKASLEAALFPADTDYLYFFSKGAGSHIFNEKYEDHLKMQKDSSR